MKRALDQSRLCCSPNSRNENLVIAGLFAGIGGFELGLSQAGHTTALLCEIDPPAREVLKAHFGQPGIDFVEDVRDVNELPVAVDVLTAGFPCQDLSSVGGKHGVRGARSSLVEEVFRILRVRPVEWVILENVPFMLSLNAGEAIQFVTSMLSSLGYRWAYRVVDSRAFGLPQRRRRVFVVASRHHDPRAVILSDDAGEPNEVSIDSGQPIGFYWTEGKRSSGLTVNGIPPLKAGSTIGIPSPPAILFSDGFVGTPDIRDAERMQGFPEDWTAPAERVAPKSVRWRLVGNAVTVNVARWLGKRLINPQQYDASDDRPMGTLKSWPTAAWSLDGEVYVAQVSPYPQRLPQCDLPDFLLYAPKPLSPKAIRGFLSRAEQGGLRFPPGFLRSLKAFAEKAEACLTGLD